MAIEIFSVHDDLVIESKFLTGITDYEYSLSNLYPLVNRLYIQRKIQNARFYERLQKDLIKGCIMPPITIAFVNDDKENLSGKEEIENYINQNIENGFILDGIQRLNTLNRTFEKFDSLDLSRPLFVNILICSSMDNLLYRMITLNNGQKPMTARHQIEILANNIYDFEGQNITIQTEKERGKKIIRGSFNKADFIKAYLAFLSESISIDNKKIIESKLDELLANKILDSDITEDQLEFSDVLEVIGDFAQDKYLRKWFKTTNNLIGFAVGIKSSYHIIKDEDINSFKKVIKKLEEAFKSYDISKIKLGKERRKLSRYVISNYEEVKTLSADDLLFRFIEVD